MEPIRRNPQDLNPGRAVPRSGMPMRSRQAFSDFTTRPHSRPFASTPTQPATAPQQPVAPTPQHHQPTTAPVPAPTPIQSQPRPQPQPQVQVRVQPTAPIVNSVAVQQQSHLQHPSPRPQHVTPTPAHSVQPIQHITQVPQTAAPYNPANQPTHPAHSAPETPVTPANSHHHAQTHHAAVPKTPADRRHGNRSSMAGFICFIVLSVLLLGPIIPGKTFDTFPGSSQSYSTGDDTLACIDTLGPITATAHYDHKLGSPITYNYATTTMQKATCDNKTESAVAGHSGQFNPLGLLIDLTLIIAISVAVTKVWRHFFDEID